MPNLLLRGIPIGEVKGVLFDKDGTLSNSEAHLKDLCERRIKNALSLFKRGKASRNEQIQLKQLLTKVYGYTSQGINPSGTLAVASRQDNLAAMANIFCLVGETWPEASQTAEEVFSRVDIELSEESSNITRNNLLPGALKLLENLNNHGVICALISNDSSAGIEKFLAVNNLSKKFSDKFWSADNFPKKPDPGAAKGLCNLLGLAPSQCAMIGDSDSDLRMAKKADLPIILGYISGWSMSPTLSQHQNLIYHWDDLNIQATTKIPHEMNAL
ncbi:HAD family hydrolase [Prochlorococcus sp. MIT 1341]|uniref:HAD family hydrolase n=1 Tax=Prochlorococcus sp. MIT 1341 TaxID=3096221 RepID=UPI002A760632|nr:HAD family hydrolase [Prochlorococcus sp. MIT 1341]